MGLFSFLKGGKNPYQSAEPHLNAIMPGAEARLGPYQDQGMQAQQNLRGQYEKMTENPGQFREDIYSQYSPSRGYQDREQRALQAMQNSQAAGGQVGSDYSQEQQGRMVNSMMDEDFQKWYQQYMDIFGAGLQGQETLAGRGYNAAENLTGMEGNVQGAKAGGAFQGQQQKNQNHNALVKFLMQAGGAAAGGAHQAGSAAASSGIW